MLGAEINLFLPIKYLIVAQFGEKLHKRGIFTAIGYRSNSGFCGDEYRRRDLNSQDRSRRILSALRLPIPPRLRGAIHSTHQSTCLATVQRLQERSQDLENSEWMVIQMDFFVSASLISCRSMSAPTELNLRSMLS